MNYFPIEPPPIKTESIDDRKLFTLPWDKWFNSIRSWMNSQVSALDAVSHVAATVEDTASIDMTITGQNISAEVVEAGVDHAQLGNINSASYTHLTATNAEDLTDGGVTSLHSHPNDHVAVTVEDTTTVDFTLSGQQISAETTGLTDTISF